jgi:hypothetical protein
LAAWHHKIEQENQWAHHLNDDTNAFISDVVTFNPLSLEKVVFKPSFKP